MSEERIDSVSFDIEKMQVILSEYKRCFKSEIWNDEDYMQASASAA